MVLSGALLRLAATGVRTLQFISSLIILGIFSYFLAVLAKENLAISTWIRAVEGIAGVATLYTLIGFFLTCCLGGVTFFAFIAILLDVGFITCFIAVASLTRGGTSNCSAISSADVLGNGDIGFGDHSAANYAPTLSAACNLLKVVFVLSLVNVFLFLVSATFQLALGRHQQRSKRTHNYEPAPTNTGPFWGRNRDADTSTGSKAPFWKRNKNSSGDAEATHLTPYDASTTGAVVAAPDTAYGHEAKYQPVGENASYYNAGHDGYGHGAYAGGQHQ